MTNDTAGTPRKGQKPEDSGEFQPPQQVRITLNRGDTNTSCRGIDQDSDARERADRLVSIFRGKEAVLAKYAAEDAALRRVFKENEKGMGQRDAIADILDRLDADDAAYWELRDRVAALEAWGAASGWSATPEPACRCPSYEVGSGEDIPECTCDRPIATEAPVRLQGDVTGSVTPEGLEVVAGACGTRLPADAKSCHCCRAQLFHKTEPVAEPEGLEVVGYANPKWRGVYGDYFTAAVVGDDKFTEALTPHATATARIDELQAEVDRLRAEVTRLRADPRLAMWGEMLEALAYIARATYGTELSQTPEEQLSVIWGHFSAHQRKARDLLTRARALDATRLGGGATLSDRGET